MHNNTPLKKLLRKIMIITAVATAILLVVIGIYPVRGNSNFPMLKDGDLAITWKPAVYQIGDLVTYRREGKRRFARIIATARDQVSISGSRLLVNGMVPAEEVFYPTVDQEHTLIYPYTVAEGMVFVLNDYREDAHDSRRYGAIALRELDGRVIYLLRRRQF